MITAINPIKTISFPRAESFSVEVVDATALKINIGRQPKLDMMHILGLEISTVAVQSRTVDDKALVNDTIFKKSFLTLETANGRDNFDGVPLHIFVPSENDGARFLIRKIVINWENCFIQLANVTGLVVGEAYYFTVYYVDPREQKGKLKKQ